MRAIVRIASLEAHITLNTYNLWKLALSGNRSATAAQYCMSATYLDHDWWLNLDSHSHLRAFFFAFFIPFYLFRCQR